MLRLSAMELPALMPSSHGLSGAAPNEPLVAFANLSSGSDDERACEDCFCERSLDPVEAVANAEGSINCG